MTNYAESYTGTTPFSDTGFQLALAAGTALSFTVPGTSANRYKAVFNWPYNANVYVGYNVTATAPTAGTLTDTKNITLRPSAKFVHGGDVLSFISTTLVSDASVDLFTIA